MAFDDDEQAERLEETFTNLGNVQRCTAKGLMLSDGRRCIIALQHAISQERPRKKIKHEYH
ncbi:MAG: hypothetical protein HZA77_03175 [Candidatus Schekmanbacteria bacterium]|nr:hypothetical protein [Candidatus Schekmanbacteria bacterium]